MPQALSPWGYFTTLLALGRIPFATEVAMWTLYGSLLGARRFSSSSLRDLHWSTILQNSLIAWATNVSINYGNEYFEWDHDRPEMLALIRKRDARSGANGHLQNGEANGKADGETNGEANGSAAGPVKNAKMLSSHTLPIHDGTIPPWVCLVLVIAWQAAVFVGIAYSRSWDPTVSSTAAPYDTFRTPFKGLALQLGIFCVTLSQEYVAPPLRLHYHGWGELISALFLCPLAMVFGMVSYYTKISGESVHLADLLSPTSGGMRLDADVWMLIGGFYLLEQARILVMHIHDIAADAEGGKRTFVVRVRQATSTKLYLLLNLLGIVLLARVYWTFEPTQQTIGRDARRFADATRTGLGWSIALAVAVIATTTQSLFAQLPATRKQPLDGRAPLLGMGALAPLVSIQLLLIPIIMTGTLIVYW